MNKIPKMLVGENISQPKFLDTEIRQTFLMVFQEALVFNCGESMSEKE